MRLIVTLVSLTHLSVVAGAAQGAPQPLGAPATRISYAFSQIGGALQLRDGRLLVADSHDHQLFLVQPAEDRVTPLGTKGQGPGEYQNSWGLTRYLADTTLVYDPRNSKFLRITPDGRIAGGIPISSAARLGGLSVPRGADASGRIYWDRVVVERAPVGDFKRRQTVDLVRWHPGTDRVDTVGRAADHAPAMHEHRFFPFAERDAWAVAPDGRVAVVVAADYHLRWLEPTGARDLAPIPVERVALSAADRTAFRRARAEQPAGAAQMRAVTPGGGGAPDAAAIRRQEVTYPDEMFPRFKPPFEERGAWLSPGGDIWVQRTARSGAADVLVDVLTPAGTVRRQFRLSADRRIVGLEAAGIYVARQDEDGLEYLERYDWPAGWR